MIRDGDNNLFHNQYDAKECYEDFEGFQFCGAVVSLRSHESAAPVLTTDLHLVTAYAAVHPSCRVGRYIGTHGNLVWVNRDNQDITGLFSLVLSLYPPQAQGLIQRRLTLTHRKVILYAPNSYLTFLLFKS